MSTSAWVEGKAAFYFGCQAQLLDNTTEKAWAEKHVVHNPAHAWIVGKYVEASRANSNGQYFELDGLRMAQPSLAHSPMNINHSGQAVGSFVATELVYPTTQAAEDGDHPYIEALGVIWKAHYPDAFAQVQQAHSEGRLYFSMECVPKRIGCIGDGGCGQIYEYAGIMSPTYCSHINTRTADRELLEPHFTGGALIIPPVRPGWKEADVHSLVANHIQESERLLAEVAAADVSPSEEEIAALEWSGAMQAVLQSHSLSRAKALGTNLLPDGRKS